MSGTVIVDTILYPGVENTYISIPVGPALPAGLIFRSLLQVLFRATPTTHSVATNYLCRLPKLQTPMWFNYKDFKYLLLLTPAFSDTYVINPAVYCPGIAHHS